MTTLIERTRLQMFARSAESKASRFGDERWLRELREIPEPPEWVRLDLDLERQHQDQWCWAAVTVSIAAHYGVRTDLTQCGLVNAVLGLDTCCADGMTDVCNVAWYLDRALTHTLTLKRLASGAPTDLTDVQAEIDAGRPVGVHIRWRGGDTGHFIVIEGYQEDGAMFAVEDPWWGTSDVDLATLLGSYQGTGEWSYTYYTGLSE